MPRRSLAFELAIVVVLSLALLVPGLARYSLVDPWETHYSEVARRMVQDHDWVHTTWQREGFASKPVLTFWAIAASLRSLGLAADGGYSGEMVDAPHVLTAVRLPFALFGALGLVLMWWMLARLVARRTAWFAWLVVGTSPFYALVARQAITDITLVACMMGAMAMFALANESSGVVVPRLRLGRWQVSATHAWLGLVGGFLLWQAGYFSYYFAAQPPLAVGPGRWPAFLTVALTWALTVGAWLAAWRLATMRQLYMLWVYAFLGLSVLGKGPAALGLFGIIGLAYVAMSGRWHDVWRGEFELGRGVVIMAALVVPWHLGMLVREGQRFAVEYFVVHLWSRAAFGVDNETGTFAYYVEQLGYGMFIWAALVPAALLMLVRLRPNDARGRTLTLVAIWAATTMAFFALIQTKFHHYILPVVPPLGILIGAWLDDYSRNEAGRSRWLMPLGAGLLWLVARDLVYEPKKWIEMFVFRYDRPWPAAPPWSVDVSDGFMALGAVGALAMLSLWWLRRWAWGRAIAVTAICGGGLAMGLWAMHAYMPEAGTHWGMREAVTRYYRERTIFGQTIIYYGPGQVWDEWHAVGNEWTFATAVPTALQAGQPMTIRVQRAATAPEPLTIEAEAALVGQVTAVHAHAVTVRFADNVQASLGPLWGEGASGARGRRRPQRWVDAERLLIWQGYWRGEVFWTGDEIMGPVPRRQTDWQLGDGDSKKFLKFLNDPALAAPGEHFFVLTSSQVTNLRGLLPTERARRTLETLDMTSNKFQLGAFTL